MELPDESLFFFYWQDATKNSIICNGLLPYAQYSGGKAIKTEPEGKISTGRSIIIVPSAHIAFIKRLGSTLIYTFYLIIMWLVPILFID